MKGALFPLVVAALTASGPALAAGGKPRLSAPPPKVQTVRRNALKPAGAPGPGCPAAQDDGPAGAGPGSPVPDNFTMSGIVDPR